MLHQLALQTRRGRTGNVVANLLPNPLLPGPCSWTTLGARFVWEFAVSPTFIRSHGLLASMSSLLTNPLDLLVSPQCRLPVRPRERRRHVGGAPQREAGSGEILLVSPRNPRRSPGLRPIARLGQRATLSWAHRAVPAQSSLFGTRQVADTRGNLVPLGPDRATALRSCTTRRASPLPGDDSSGMVRWGASQVALACRAGQELILANDSKSRKRCKHRASMFHAS
jgi:hypothetical protein